jgi:hypothetical protein
MRSSILRVGGLPLLAGIAIAAVAPAGCGRAVNPVSPAGDEPRQTSFRAQPTGAETGGPNFFFPLEVGNHWRYARSFTATILSGEDEPPMTLVDMRFQDDRELVCVEPRDGRDYLAMHIVSATPTLSNEAWERYRQDRSGLYQAYVPYWIPAACTHGARHQAEDTEDAIGTSALVRVAILAKVNADQQAAVLAAWDRMEARASASPSPRAATSPGAGEITVLPYPLHTGARWRFRTTQNVPFEAVVEGQEILNLSIGRVPSWRIRLVGFLMDPGDRYYVWFGREGLLKRSFHSEGPLRPPLGVVVSENHEELVGLSLRR